jgi:hypothetical protein
MLPKKIRLFSLVVLGAVTLQAMPAGSRITLPNGKKIFVSGMNLAWKNFANDVGDTPLDTAYFDKAMKDIADSGGNCIRVWLSTNGTKDPKYNSDGLVSGPGSQTITNIKKMLKLAKKHNILLMPVLLTHNWVEKSINSTILENNKKMLKTEEGLKAYIDNYLIPVVTEIGNDPNLICWEIFNEPEGMVMGWSSPANTITEAEVKRSVNWIAAAIKDAVPGVLVSNGAATIGHLSWYKDDVLKSVGGKENGTLDFYMAHYYGWNGTSNSPFTKSYSHWNLDKPLVIGEYASTDWSRSTSSSSPMQDAGKVDTLLVYLNRTGYAGGLGWQYQPDAGDPWMRGFETFSHSMMEVYREDSNSIKLDGISSNTFAISVSSSNGGTVKRSLVGRVELGKSDTLTAIAAEGYSFEGWSGDTTATDPVLIIKSVERDWSLQANFVPDAGTNLIKGGDFSDPTLWGTWVNEEKGNEATITISEGQAKIIITKADTLNYNIQLSQGGIKLDSGVTYLVTFEAWSSERRPLYVGLSTEGTWHFQGGSEIELGTSKKKYDIEITPDSSTTAGILQFNAGASTKPVYIDNVTMVIKPSSVWKYIRSFNRTTSFNQVGQMIHWSAVSNQATADLLNLNGRVIKTVSKNVPLSLKEIPSGLYLFRINDGINSRAFRVSRY